MRAAVSRENKKFSRRGKKNEGKTEERKFHVEVCT